MTAEPDDNSPLTGDDFRAMAAYIERHKLTSGELAAIFRNHRKTSSSEPPADIYAAVCNLERSSMSPAELAGWFREVADTLDKGTITG